MSTRRNLGSFATLAADPVAPYVPQPQSAFEKAIASISSLTNSANQAYNIYTGKVPPQPVKPATDWNKVLLYGGLAIGGVALLMMMKKKR